MIGFEIRGSAFEAVLEEAWFSASAAAEIKGFAEVLRKDEDIERKDGGALGYIRRKLLKILA